MTEDRGKLRISNADRDEAIALLQQALDEGRIELGEFDERAKHAYGAKTQAELDLIFEDLPVERGGAVEVAGERGRADEGAQARSRPRVPSSFQPLLVVGLITTTIWLVSSIASWELQSFWPAWPIGILAAIGIAQWITGDDDDDDDDDDEQRAKHDSC